MGEASFQKFFQRYVWNSSKKEERDGSMENPNIPLDPWLFGGGNLSQSGKVVTPEMALGLSAVWRCVSILSGIISYLPSKPFRELDNGSRIIDKEHPTYKLFTRRPGPLYTKSVYWERAIIHLLLRGNHYSEIVTNKGGDISQFNLILPTQIEHIVPKDSKLWYKIKDRDQMIPSERMIHVPHMGEDFMGKSTITYAREDLGMEAARREAGAKFWNDGGDPKSILTASQKLSPTQEAQLKQSFKNAKKEGGTIVAPFGVDVKNMSMSPADQEFIMSGNFSIAAIARWFGVPLHKLSELERATLNNVEQMAIEMLQDTIAPIVEKLEDEYTTKCYTLPDEQDLVLNFDMDAYQRADSVSRSQLAREQIQNGLRTPNELRAKDNLPPVEGGDQTFIQLNMQRTKDVGLNLSKPPVSVKSSREALKKNVSELLQLMELEDKQNGNGH